MLDFSAPGNASEILWAGVLTLIAIVGSVLISIWIQRKDFDRREKEQTESFNQRQAEVNATLTAQAEADLQKWRRHMAERMIDLISQAASYAIDRKGSRAAILQDAEGIHTILHMDNNDEFGMGAWIESKCRELIAVPHVHSQAEYNHVADVAGRAKVKPMLWAYASDAISDDPEIAKAKDEAHGHASRDVSA
ncbi:hypothetical protein IG195_21455 (plasmid) [Arthrobacter sp. TES]|uniref:Uncharacterized protein n=3 Tax=Micrococcaceae TaxID=1268 RepID=Q6SKF8_PAEAU|nr:MULTISPECIES: hypothetical protein [Micrococcaceae]AAS20013.1 hypothetical protein [Paenarthrobacter aurescens]ERI35270.1 hypothetical protein M707_22570 [Arthrobacter sp. AK-YN10]QOI65911.1 hypothetical protein IG195_21455 [Arthrobacter sp. TES]ABM10504.1 hypothetical protein AAur_pTC10245 [Paenarthrobacter aurescens TC1]MCY0975520.1 hypothetical protein [Paenarthrobacter ureafaciens]